MEGLERGSHGRANLVENTNEEDAVVGVLKGAGRAIERGVTPGGSSGRRLSVARRPGSP